MMETPDLKRILRELGAPEEKLSRISMLGLAVVEVAYKSGLKDADAKLLFNALGKLMEEATAAISAVGVDAVLTSVMSDDQLARMDIPGPRH